ncbi:hypothetical protein [Rhizobium binae]|uniref:Uncharacterized protein n=1 Tax=Rhizobium binae TaxID=1138190 RepID=A0ABV2MA29_9HYPH|nr:hypothetical protein [Rhizobium binae]MBX4928952.1 hypothetical protein [Rhizobium binae]MBX4941799.1 hypothetical protein [Rhizobium binae]MBX4947814.1 hypothetical protein [Rhizobium binae]MBX4965706.1 hypothetical protein [Rhizobium binae]MBX4966093.1 hypothetical protein [Rhizobium binae]
MLLSSHGSKSGSETGRSAAFNTAEWLSMSATADGAAAKPAKSARSWPAAEWLSLAAAPTFAIMALLTAATGSTEMICMTAPDAFPISGMVPMYLLMSGFHLAPWLRLVASWQAVSRR